MYCKNCGRELPDEGKFCPFCGEPSARVGVNDETAVFRPQTGQTGPIDISAFDAALNSTHNSVSPDMEDSAATGDPIPLEDGVIVDHTPHIREAEPVQQPPPKRPGAPHTTYFEADPNDSPYHKPSVGRKIGVALLVIVIIGALAGGGVWFVMSRRPDENLTAAEEYMEHGQFDDALAAYEDALPEARNPSAIQLQIDKLKSYKQACELMESGDFASALATLSDLEGRITDSTSKLAEEVEDMQEQARLAIEDKEFAEDIRKAQEYLDDGKYDAAAEQLDSLALDPDLTSDQREQVAKITENLEKAQAAAQRQEEDKKEKAEKKEYFRNAIEKLEENDKKLVEAKTLEEELELTTKSFESWDSLLTEMYNYLATILNADLYVAEEEKYKQWIKERDENAANAAKESLSVAAASAPEEGSSDSSAKETPNVEEDPEKPEESKEKPEENKEKPEEKTNQTASELAAMSIKHSFTKTLCYRIFAKIE